MVVDAFELQQRGAQDACVLSDAKVPGVFDGQAVGEGMADGSVPRDAFGQGQRLLGVLSFEVAFDALVDEPQARLHAQDGLAHHPETKVARFDKAGVDGADGDLVDAGTLDGHEGERTPVGDERRCRAGVAAHRMPTLGPVLMEHEAARLGVTHRDDTEEVGELSLEPAGRKGQRGQGRHAGLFPIQGHVELDPAIWRSGGEEIDDTHLGAVVVTRDKGETHAFGEQCLGDVEQVPRRHMPARAAATHGHPIAGSGNGRDHSATERAAASSRLVSGQAKTPMAAHTASPPTSGASANRRVHFGSRTSRRDRAA